MSIEYVPIQRNTDLEEVIRRVNEYLQELQADLDSREPTEFLEAPQAPFNGMLFYADVANWNPGSGTGVYTYWNGYIKLS